MEFKTGQCYTEKEIRNFGFTKEDKYAFSNYHKDHKWVAIFTPSSCGRCDYCEAEETYNCEHLGELWTIRHERYDSVEGAIKWILEQVQKPTFDNGDPNPIPRMMAEGLVEELSHNTLWKFERELIRLIYEELDKEIPCILMTDYQPVGILAEAAKVAGLPETNFPWKTRVTITRDKYEVKLGATGKVESFDNF